MKETKRLTRVEELGESAAALLFKHSSRCSISDTVLEEVREVATAHDSIELFIVDVIQDRDLCREIAERSGIQHESPQVILFKEGKAVWHGSHYEATPRALEKAMRSAI